MAHVLATFGQFERRLIGQRTAARDRAATSHRVIRSQLWTRSAVDLWQVGSSL
jgi:hypothetical protein